ncbi:MAG: hypothetical protein U0414_25940 [Polyangiaceae bacterium]
MNGRHFAFALVAVGALLSAGCDDSTNSSGTTSGAGETCTPTTGCPTAAPECVGLVDNTGKTNFALRISHLEITQPAALTTQTVKALLDDGVQINLGECKSENGTLLFPTTPATGAFSWILNFDTTAKTLKTGGALPAENPADGYCFVDKTIDGFAIKPLEVSAPIDANGNFEIAMPADVVVPVYADRTATTVILLPLKSVKITMAKLSNNNNCLGSYNGAALGDNFCAASADVPKFNDAATLVGFATLEDADAVTVSQLKKSLCVLLAGDNAAMFTDPSGAKCLRDMNNQIVLKGDWCAATNSAATDTCHDAMKLQGTFAASSVAMKTSCP